MYVCICVYVYVRIYVCVCMYICDRLYENVHSSHLVVIRETPV